MSAVALALWLCGRHLAEADVRAALGPELVSELLSVGVLLADDASGEVYSPVQCYPLPLSPDGEPATSCSPPAEVWVATDWCDSLGLASLELAYTAPRDIARRRVLEVCCGCGGVQALVAASTYASYVVASDTCERRTRLIRFSAALSGVAEERLSVVQGDAYDGLEGGETFDMILCSPRGVALPDAASEAETVRVCAEVSASTLLLCARDVQSGRAVCLRISAQDIDDDADANLPSAGAAPASHERVLPQPWRFEAAYTDDAHPGLCCGGGRFIRVPPLMRHPAESRVAADGEVDPSVTADTVWPGAFLLASYLSQPIVAQALAGTRVVELGAGSGVPGLAAWVAGASSVVLTDLPENLERLRCVAACNGAGKGKASVEVATIDWCAPLEARLHCDVVLAADCVFWPKLFAPLLDTLHALVNGQRESTRAPPMVLLTVTRRLDRAERFASAATAAGWSIEEVGDCHVAFPHTSIWRLSWENPK